MTVTLELPSDLEESLRRENPNLEAEVKEACAVELFRQYKLDHFQLSQVLGIDRHETDAVLQRHKVTEQALTLEDVERDVETLRRVLG